jgi:hypothetical protein
MARTKNAMRKPTPVVVKTAAVRARRQGDLEDGGVVYTSISTAAAALGLSEIMVHLHLSDRVTYPSVESWTFEWERER